VAFSRNVAAGGLEAPRTTAGALVRAAGGALHRGTIRCARDLRAQERRERLRGDKWDSRPGIENHPQEICRPLACGKLSEFLRYIKRSASCVVKTESRRGPVIRFRQDRFAIRRNTGLAR
jgi:hypothetical protein